MKGRGAGAMSQRMKPAQKKHRMRRGRLTSIFDRLNDRYFEGELPPVYVKQDFRYDSGVEGWLDPKALTIHLSKRLVGADVERVILHEMIHLKTGGDHDDAFWSELHRLAKVGAPMAQVELTDFKAELNELRRRRRRLHARRSPA